MSANLPAADASAPAQSDPPLGPPEPLGYTVARAPRQLLTEEEAQHILRSYSLRLRSLRRIPRGTINTNFWVDTDAGPAFLRINEGKTEEEVRFESELIWHLGSHGLLTPQLWRTRSSQPYVMWRRDSHAAAQPVMLMTWVDAHERTETELTPAHTYIVGALLGQLHLCTAGFPQARPGIYTVARIKGRLHRMQADPRATAEVGPLLGELLAEAEALQPAHRRALPSGIGHGDLFPDNLLFSSWAHRRARRARQLPDALAAGGGLGLHGQLGWILDLEQAATIPLVYDLAVALLAFCAPVHPAASGSEPTVGPLDRARAQALVAGYQTMRVLGEAEWSALPGELRWAAVRFTTTRLTDIECYGQPTSAAPPSPADPADPLLTAAAPPARRARIETDGDAAPAHSKDYRDFAHRLTLLRPLTAPQLQAALQASRPPG